MRAWDLPTRLFHWTLVTLIGCAWLSYHYANVIGDPTLRWHRWNGMAILVLVVFRVLWGFVGSSTSRFSAFIRWPWVALGYGLDLLRGKTRHYLGHNPLGSWMIVVLLLAVALQAIGGLYTLEHNEITAGPLQRTISDATTEWVSKWHRRGFNLLLALIALHVLANSLYQIIKKDPLITAMVSGKKPSANYEDTAEAVIVPHAGRRALGCLLVAAVLVFGSIVLLGGRLI
ncbi:MAG: cytochrome b/b6 domain-containing protein [Bosea sp. (in: a-proteobacteria)]